MIRTDSYGTLPITYKDIIIRTEGDGTACRKLSGTALDGQCDLWRIADRLLILINHTDDELCIIGTICFDPSSLRGCKNHSRSDTFLSFFRYWHTFKFMAIPEISPFGKSLIVDKTHTAEVAAGQCTMIKRAP